MKLFRNERQGGSIFPISKEVVSPLEPTERLRLQLEMFAHIARVAQRIGVLDKVRAFGGVAYPCLRDRVHGDIDIVILGKQAHDLLVAELLQGSDGITFTKHSLLPLKGSCMSYLHSDTFTAVGPVEFRYVEPTILNGIPVAVHRLPFWVKPILRNKELIIPMSVFSSEVDTHPQHSIDFGGIAVGIVYPEFAYLIKKRSLYPKDREDCVKLEKAGLNRIRLHRIEMDIKAAQAIFLLPHELMQIIRKLGIFELTKEQHTQLVGVSKTR